MIDRIKDEYFDWMYKLVCGKRYSKQISYRKLLVRLHDTPFRYSISFDENRARDGANLRYRFAKCGDYDNVDEILDILDGPCSVLEMMIALAIHCEVDIMDDPAIGDRTGQWFWEMITNLGLGSMINSRFDRQYVDDVLNRFLDREYEPDGRGGLFYVRNCNRDLRDVEIWVQMCWFLNTIT